MRATCLGFYDNLQALMYIIDKFTDIFKHTRKLNIQVKPNTLWQTYFYKILLTNTETMRHVCNNNRYTRKNSIFKC